MKRSKIGFFESIAFVLLLTAAAGCDRAPVAEPPRFSEVPAGTSPKGVDAKTLEALRKLPANRQAGPLSQPPRPPAPLPVVNPAADIQRSLQTVEEINRLNRLNQQIRQSQQQNR